MSHYYDKTGSPLTEAEHLARAKELWSREYRGVGLDYVDIDGVKVRVSTVFLCINHEYRPGLPPLIFESMLFVDDDNDHEHHCWCRRYSTIADAESGHQSLVSTLRDGRWPE